MTDPVPGKVEINAEDLLALLEGRTGRNGVPSASACLVTRDGLWTASVGITSVENPILLSEEARFRLGSVTKVITTLALVRILRESGPDLDDSVDRVLGTRRLKLRGAHRLSREISSHQVTSRQLLTHTAEWDGDYACRDVAIYRLGRSGHPLADSSAHS